MSKLKVPYLDLGAQYQTHKDEILSEIDRVMSNAEFILRKDVEIFENQMEQFLGSPNVIGLNSGTDALFLGIAASPLARGDEVITAGYTYVATLSAITHNGCTPVLVDIGDDLNMDLDLVESKITDKTKAIIPVHLNGRLCDMARLEEIARRYDLVIIEDAAQALGARYDDRSAGTFGEVGAFSLHPMKTLSCAGDGGFLSTPDSQIADKVKLLRNHGQRTKIDIECYGVNSRLDNIQAAILNVRMKHLDNMVERRRAIAERYCEKFNLLPIRLPPAPSTERYFDAYNSFVIQTPRRDDLAEFLSSREIGYMIPWPKPLYLQSGLALAKEALTRTEQACRECLSLPIYPEMSGEQIAAVVQTVTSFFD